MPGQNSSKGGSSARPGGGGGATTASASATAPPNDPSALPAHLLTLATLRLLTLSPDSRFTQVRAIPLHVLAELTHRYLELLAHAAKQCAEQAGRTSANSKDVVRALDRFGSSLNEVWEWSEDRRLGGEGVQMAAAGDVHPATLGALLSNDRSVDREPFQTMEYGPLTRSEERELALLQNQPVVSARKSRGGVRKEDDEEEQPTSLGEDEPLAPPPSILEPPDLLSFLPPMPDLSAIQEQVQTVVEDESGRIVKRARKNFEGAGSNNPWLRSVQYEASTLAEFDTQPLPVNAVSTTDASLSMASSDLDQASSLPHFLETLNYVSLEQLASGSELLPLRQNAKRRRAATAIHSNILNPSDDSLSGAFPTQQPRHAKRQAGWIPYPPLTDRDDPSDPSGKAIQPIPSLHPYTTMLPPSVAEPLPSMVLPHPTRMLAPSMHPRQPTAHSSIRTLLEASQASLFSRTTRLGPPGPLLENGAAGFYDVETEKAVIPGWVGDTVPRMMSWSFDWEIPDAHSDSLKASTPGPRSAALGVAADPFERYAGPAFPQLPSRALENAAKKSKSVANGHGHGHTRQLSEQALPIPAPALAEETGYGYAPYDASIVEDMQM